MKHGLSQRKLTFDKLDDAVRDAESLLDCGYDQAGNWDLGQVCGHLVDWMRFPLDGFPKQPLPIRIMLFAVRVTIGRREIRKVLAAGAMKHGNPTLPGTVYAPGGDEAEAVDRFHQTVARFQSHAGPLHPSPVFGDLDYDTVRQLQLIHCAHHLGFLIPRVSPAANVPPQ